MACRELGYVAGAAAGGGVFGDSASTVGPILLVSSTNHAHATLYAKWSANAGVGARTGFSRGMGLGKGKVCGVLCAGCWAEAGRGLAGVGWGGWG